MELNEKINKNERKPTPDSHKIENELIKKIIRSPGKNSNRHIHVYVGVKHAYPIQFMLNDGNEGKVKASGG